MGTTWGDPHLNLANGGQADFRGVDKQFFSFLSAPNISVTVMTEDRSFVRWGGQVRHARPLSIITIPPPCPACWFPC